MSTLESSSTPYKSRYKSCWIITDEGKIGTENQCVGLADALGLKYMIKRVRPKSFWKFLPPKLWLNPLACINIEIAPPWPSVIIGAGRASSAPVAYIREASQGRTKVIQLLSPYLNPKNFDMVVAPEHDQLLGRNVVETQGALNRLNDTVLQEGKRRFAPLLRELPRPLVTVLIGGSNKYYKLTPQIIAKLVSDLKKLVIEKRVGLAVTISRRTEDKNVQLIRKGLKNLPAVIWDGTGPNPYFGFLAHADYILVTEDSVSMVSEACYTGKPVYVLPLEGHSAKFEHFHKSMQNQGYTRTFKGNLERFVYTPLRETQRVAEKVVQELELNR